MATTGVVGQPWRASVTGTGVVEPDDGTAPLGWYVAADDRWHDPRTDLGVRHRRIAGTAVFETKVRIPGGDAVQRVWSIADAGGYTLVSIDNDSPGPIAVAFTRGDLATNRPATSTPARGISLPADAVVFPIGHRANLTVGLAHDRRGASVLPDGLASADAVVRGWIARTDVASRLDVPDQALVEAVRAARCEVLLGRGVDIDADPERYLLTVGELARLGEVDPGDAVALAPAIAAAVEATARRGHPLATAALDAAAVVLAAAGERSALIDLARLGDALAGRAAGTPDAGGVDITGDVAVIPTVERRIVAGPVLFPGGIPRRWWGCDFAVHRLIAGPASVLSMAIRWHGPNAAVLWDVEGEAVTLTTAVGSSPWSTSSRHGEDLWVLGDS